MTYSANGTKSGTELRAALPWIQDRPSCGWGRSYASAADGAGFEPSPRCQITSNKSESHNDG